MPSSFSRASPPSPSCIIPNESGKGRREARWLTAAEVPAPIPALETETGRQAGIEAARVLALVASGDAVPLDVPVRVAAQALVGSDERLRELAIRTLAAVASGRPIMIDLALQLAELAIEVKVDSRDEIGA